MNKLHKGIIWTSILVLPFWLWVFSAFGATQNIYLDNAGAGAGSEGDPYGAFSEINWTTGGANSIFDWVAASDDVQINLKKGVTWREQLTVGTSGASGHPITIQAYGSGADPVISGADLVSMWTEKSPLGSELVTNGNFDSDASGWDAWSNTISHEGGSVGGRSNTGKNTSNGGDFGACNQACISGETNYRLTFKYYIPQSNTTVNEIDVWRITGSQARIALVDVLDTWTDSSVDFTTAASNTKLYFYHSSDGSRMNSTNGDLFYIDNVSVKELQANANTWQAALISEPSKVFFDGAWGNKQTALLDVDSAYDWYWTANVLYIYSTSDPDTAYTSPGIESVIRDYCIDTNDCDYLVIQKLELGTCEEASILINESNNLIIEKNTLIGSYKDAINFTASVGSDDNIVRYNKIQNNRRYGIYWAADANKSEDCEIYCNLIYGNHDDGIRVDNNQSGNLIYNNTIDSNLGNGIYFAAVSGFTVKNNLLNANRDYELKADNASTITHNNNCYYRSDQYGTLSDNIIYNGTGYNRDEIVGSFEATAIISNPFSISEIALSAIVDGSAIASDGAIYAYSTSLGAWGIYKSTDNGQTWTLSRAHTGGLVVFIDSRNYVYTSPCGDPDAGDKGLFRSTDNGGNWTRVLDLSSFANMIGIWGFAEDSNGHLYAGIYNNKNDAGHKAYIYKSTDSGASFSQVYYSATYEHVHDIAIDTSTDYVYATLGDTGDAIIRSIDGGSSWSAILSNIPQCVAALATNSCRLFGIDAGASTTTIYRTIDDVNWDIVYKGEDSAGFVFWFRTDGTRIYAGTTYSNTTYKGAIFISEDDGLTWEIRKAVPNGASWSGTPRSSHIVDGKFIYNSYEGNGVLLYTGREDNFTLGTNSPCRHGATYLSGYETKLRPEASWPSGVTTMKDILSIGAYGIYRGSAGM